MSNGSAGEQQPDPVSGATSQIIQQGINQLREHNEQANAELTETLQDLRENV